MSSAPTTWPDLAVSLYDHLTGRRSQITYQFEDFGIEVPASANPGAATAHWKVNGTLRIQTADAT